MREHGRTGYPLGNATFVERLERTVGRRLRPGKSGRPSKLLKRPKSVRVPGIVCPRNRPRVDEMNWTQRKGLRVRGHRGHPVVRRALIRFAAWLRREYDFPIRVPVYLFPSDHIITADGHKVSASFFAPFRRDEEPLVRIATGDYVCLRNDRGRDDALAAFINSFAHEIVHYQQWVATGRTWERGVAVKADAILRKYAENTQRP